HRRGRRGADFEHGDANDSESQQHLEVERVVARDPDVPIAILSKNDESPCGLRMVGQEIGFLPDLWRPRVHRIGWGAMVWVVLIEMSVKHVVAVGIVLQHNAAALGADLDAFDPWNGAQRFLVFFQTLGISLRRRNLHPDPAWNLMRDLEPGFLLALRR